ncbi:MAG: glycosyltransferase family 4 protein [Mycobacteriales bacterium]
MRILTINNTYPPHYYGGYELTCADVMDRFRAVGHDVTVLTSDIRVPNVMEADPSGPDVRRRLRPYWDWERGAPDRPLTPIGRLRVERRNLAALRQAVADTRPEVVSVWHMIGLSMSLLTWLEQQGIPMVLMVANDWLMQAPEFDAWSRMFDNPVGRRLGSIGGVPTRLPRLDHAPMTFVSEYTKRRSAKLSRFPVPSDAPVIPPGIDTVDFPVRDVVEVRTPAERGWSVLYVGRLDPVKGVETLVRAVAGLDEQPTLSLMGGGSAEYATQLRDLAEQLGVSDRLSFGRCSRRELREHYMNADVVVFPSEWEEPFGLVPLESMACGTPVVASGTGGAADFLVDGTNCVLFRAGDSDDLGRALRQVTTDLELRTAVVAGGLETARTITIDRYADGLLGLHEAAARSGSPARRAS